MDSSNYVKGKNTRTKKNKKKNHVVVKFYNVLLE